MRLSAHAWPPVADAGLASCTRSFAHESAKPVLRMPPGYSVVCGVVDHRQRRDRGQARRPRRGDEQLADAAVGDADHADLAARRPRLPRDGLDHVVAVEPLERLEEVERPARAAGAAHVDVDDRVAEQVGDRGDRALAAVGVRVAVARVLDQRRVRPGPARQAHVDRELDAVARGQVAVAAARDPLPVEPRRRRRRAVGEHAHALAAHAVACRASRCGTPRRRACPRAARRACRRRPASASPRASRPVTYTCSTLPRAFSAAAAVPGRARKSRRASAKVRGMGGDSPIALAAMGMLGKLKGAATLAKQAYDTGAAQAAEAQLGGQRAAGPGRPPPGRSREGAEDARGSRTPPSGSA